MEPNHEELFSLNPRLKMFPPEKLSSLLATIKSCGWEWNANCKYFELPKFKTAIRTEGLDIFDADSFREHHNDIIQGATLHPKEYSGYQRGMYLWQKMSVPLVLALIVDLLLGWALLSIKLWITSILCLITLLVVLYKYVRKQKNKFETKNKDSNQ